MDFQNRVGVKHGRKIATKSEDDALRRARLRKLAMETIDLSKDPYFMQNSVGSFECKLCLTLHANEGSYLSHTQGKKHVTNLKIRAAKENKTHDFVTPASGVPTLSNIQVKKVYIKIGRPGYRVTKLRDGDQLGMLFQIHYPDIGPDIIPRHRFMSAFEQKVEPPSKYFQYLLFAAEPYETVGFKIQSFEVDPDESKTWHYWDPITKQYHCQFFFKPVSQS